MLNKVIVIGRITKDLELKQTPTGRSVLTFNVAIDRDYVKKGEERQADFVTCVAWDKTADFINQYFGKGKMIAIDGSLRSRTYDDDKGSTHYITEVYVSSVSFTGEPRHKSDAPKKPYGKVAEAQEQAENNQQVPLEGFEEILNEDGDVPF